MAGSRRTTLVLTSGAALMVALDQLVVSTALTTMQRQLHASLQTLDATTGASLTDKSAWRELLPPVRLLPDTPHRFRVTGQPATHVRLNIFPDGGVARLRLYGSLTDDGLAAARRRWAETA